MPNLQEKNVEIFDYMESIQPYHPETSWLADFSEVTNDIKHQHLTPQTRIDTIRFESSREDNSVSWNPSAVRFGTGVFINGAPVNPSTQMPIQTPETTLKKEIWVNFLFMEKIHALDLMQNIVDKLPGIVSNTYKLLSHE